MESWRLIPPLTVSGKLQMRIDTWLLEQHRQGYHPPTLRFYTWEPIAISLGYHQHHYPPLWDNLTWQGQTIELIRRPSGGRAVLHQGDLTYSIITSKIPGPRRQIYEHLCQFLMDGWHKMGVPLYYGSGERGYIHHPNCFTTATAADLVTETGYKLIGSAQLYRSQAILQHGSIRLNPDRLLFNQVFGEAIDPPSLPPLPQVIDTLTQAAKVHFGIELIPQPLSPKEWEMIQEGGVGCDSK